MLTTKHTSTCHPSPLTEIMAEELLNFIQTHPRLLILTGAGISTDSGIPDYRDIRGEWKQKQPVQHQNFMSSHKARQRYWARSLPGWPIIRDAKPNPSHHALVELELKGHVNLLITQNVDRLHQKAGSQKVIDLHGRSDEVVCMNCDYRVERNTVHSLAAEMNPLFSNMIAEAAPDGDAHIEMDFSRFQIPDCPECGGILKPDVVFFGDNVPKQRVHHCLETLKSSDALLVIGSSLMVYSGFRFCRYAHDLNKPIATLTLGKTRADELSQLKINAPIQDTLTSLLTRI